MARVGYPVRISVAEVIRGECPLKYKPGDSWLVRNLVPEGLCAIACSSLMPFVWTVNHGGSALWDDSRKCLVCCPDADNPVAFRVERA